DVFKRQNSPSPAMTTRGLGTACRPADGTLVIAAGAACRAVRAMAAQAYQPSPDTPAFPPGDAGGDPVPGDGWDD
ncbi:hypothetical protein PV341_42440, partial [Streptomyces sp. PA03-1a]|nr:hypothetical protein [Streptomyces sp. PA03-1a]